jgi:hypothetical protein
VELSWQKRRVLVAAGSVRNTPDDGEGDDDDKEMMMMQVVSDEVMPRDRTRTRPNTHPHHAMLSRARVSVTPVEVCAVPSVPAVGWSGASLLLSLTRAHFY